MGNINEVKFPVNISFEGRKIISCLELKFISDPVQVRVVNIVAVLFNKNIANY